MIESQSRLMECSFYESPRPQATDGRTKRLIRAMQEKGGELTYVGSLALRMPDGTLLHDAEEETGGEYFHKLFSESIARKVGPAAIKSEPIEILDVADASENAAVLVD